MEYLSQECYDRLTQELNDLVSVELPKARNELEEARAKGDLSENFEYHAAKRAHGRLLSRISYMQKTLRFARVMDTSRLDNDTVGLLRRVEITNLATNTTMATPSSILTRPTSRRGRSPSSRPSPKPSSAEK